ncbi:MAG: insulinase family protein [Treponema sp.]|nr:insulinase family protein [Treponema sp.]
MGNKTVLKNNVVLVSEYMPHSHNAAIGFMFSVGSRHEKECERGISHFCEHMLFKGTKSRKRRDIVYAFDKMGGLVNAFTERDDVFMYSVLPSSPENISTVVEILCDMTQNCIFPADEIEKERTVIQNEISAVEDDIEESSIDQLADFIWHNQDLAQTITGSADDVASITREQLFDWYEKYFKNGPLTVFISGNFEIENVVSMLEKLPDRKNLDYSFNAKFYSGFKSKKSRFNQNQLYYMYPLRMPLDLRHYYTLLVFNALFGDTMTSRLFEHLREDRGLCYSVYSFMSCYSDTGVWGASVSCDLKQTLQTLDCLKKEFSTLCTDDFSDEEITLAKEHLCGEELMGCDDVEYVMKKLQRHYLLSLPLLDAQETIGTIRSIEKNDIIEFVSENIKNIKPAVFVYGKKIVRDFTI